MKFRIHCERSEHDKAVFVYDNETNTLSDEFGNVWEYPNASKIKYDKKARVFSRDNPMGKSNQIRILKIQLGLSCNYSCDYCSQRFVERAPETSRKDIEEFMRKLENLEFNEQTGLRIELWGGEPLVYWKTIKPLTEALQEKFKEWEVKPSFLMITNGSLLTPTICDWLYDNGFGVAISHDAMAQHVRGPDPLEDPKKKETILAFYKRMKAEGRISFNSMLHASNMSRLKVYEWFVELTGDPNVALGEGALVDSYDEGGYSNSLQTKKQHFEFRQTAFNDIYSTEGQIGFGGVIGKIDSFVSSVLTHKPADTLGQKCGMDDEHVVSIDLRGNVITCQNTSAVETSMNGESHLVGNIENMQAVEIKTSTHWRNRPDCSSCPVLHLCRGSCMYVEGKHWEASCNNAYSDNVALFALAIEKMTNGYIPVYIEADHLPDMRRDIWGTLLDHPEEQRRKVIPIKMEAPQKMIVNDVEVYKTPTAVSSTL